MLNKKNLISALFLGLVVIFFVWRAYQLAENRFHIVVAVIFAGLTVAALFGYLSRRWQSNSLNGGVSLIFLDLVFAGLPLNQVGQELASANYWLVIPALVALILHLVCRIWRWQWLLKPMGDIAFGPAFRAGMIGIGGNMILPARAGEFLRAYVIGRSCRISKTGAFATVVLERFFDGATIVLVLVLLFVFGLRDPQLQPYAIAGAVFYSLVLVGLVIMILWQNWFEAVMARLLPRKLAQRILPMLQRFTNGLNSLRNMKQLSMIIALSLITWALVPLSFYPVLAAFDYGVPLPAFAAVLMLPMVAIGLMIPAGPGGIGTFEKLGELAMIVSFQAVGTPLSEEQRLIAVASVILVHLTQAIPEAVLGLWAFMQEGLTLEDLKLGQTLNNHQ